MSSNICLPLPLLDVGPGRGHGEVQPRAHVAAAHAVDLLGQRHVVVHVLLATTKDK